MTQMARRIAVLLLAPALHANHQSVKAAARAWDGTGS
jgi:hypothetical protein